MRTAEVFKSNHWIKINLMDIKVGMKIRMFEKTGEPVVAKGGITNFIVESDAYYNENGVICVDIS